jgi:hypothetical protein
MTRARKLSAAIAAILACGALAGTASDAFAGSGTYASHYGPLASGADQPAGASFFVTSGTFQDGISTGTAFTAIWFVNSSQVRISAEAFCETAGCYTSQSWSGSFPSGYPIVHNHGNASPSFFNGTVDWL